MQDGIIAGTGNSRFLKSAIASDATWEQFRDALNAGTLPIDLNGINEDGWQQIGKALNKANLLSDAAETQIWGDANDRTVNEAFLGLIEKNPWNLLQSYTTAGTYTWTVPDINGDGLAYEIGVYEIGGGGSGGAAIRSNSGEDSCAASGGASGRAKRLILIVTPGNEITVVVGTGGAAVAASGISESTNGNTGGSTSFNGVVVDGGDSGQALHSSTSVVRVSGATGGQGSDAVTTDVSVRAEAPAMGVAARDSIDGTYNYMGGDTWPIEAINLFDGKCYLAAGGGAKATYSAAAFQTCPTLDDGNSGGSSYAALQSGTSITSITAGSASGHGNGGGAAALYLNGTYYDYSATSGAGSDGAVFIYVRRAVS